MCQCLFGPEPLPELMLIYWRLWQQLSVKFKSEIFITLILVAICLGLINGLCPRGGYSLYIGWYGCAAVLTPFFDILGIERDLFGVLFLIHWHQNDLLGVLKLPILTEFDLFGPKFRFSLNLFGSNFQWPAAHPHRFSDRVPPPPPRGYVSCALTHCPRGDVVISFIL